MADSEYDFGDMVRCSAAFTNCSDVAVDPGTVTFRVQDPSGNDTAYVYGADAEVVRDGTGEYHVDLSIDEVGKWHYRWEGSGTYQAADEAAFYVARSVF